jgi:bifunctional non-homologous end joining protein LigD
VTGRRGIQIWIPIVPSATFAETRAWVETLSRTIGRVVPESVSWSWEKAERGGRARLDDTQNAINKMLVAPHSTRPAPGAPVSVPIAWDELEDPEPAPTAGRSPPCRTASKREAIRCASCSRSRRPSLCSARRAWI